MALTIGFLTHGGKERACAAERRLRALAERRHVAVTAAPAEADVLVALGGDGTILRAVRAYPGVPVVGFNVGGLGYLSSVGESDFEGAFAKLAAGDYRIAERTMLSADACGEALNDIALTRELSGHAVRLELFADGHRVTTYLADGLIFATPTGSTAYSLAAGGPVLMPDSAGFVVTPVNPHALGVRPLVVRDTVRFTVRICPRTDGNDVRVGVHADGENVRTLAAGDRIEIARSARTARLVELSGYDPYAVLANKLGWSGSALAS